MSKIIIERNPFRQGTASRAIHGALAEAAKPLSADEIRQRTRLSKAKVHTLLTSYHKNRFHTAPLRRVGVVIERSKDGGYRLRLCKPDPKAKRPPRGQAGRKAKGQAKRPPKAQRPAQAPAENPQAPPNEAQAPAGNASSQAEG